MLLAHIINFFQNQLDFDFDQNIVLQDADSEFYEFVADDGSKMFFPPPRRHELEIIEKHLAIFNNNNFIEEVNNPTAIFWFLINLIKNWDHQLTEFPINIDINEERQSMNDILIDHHKYIPTKRDNHHIIHQNNINKFNKRKFDAIKKLFNHLSETQLQMDEHDLFADLQDNHIRQSNQEQQQQDNKSRPNRADISQIQHI